MLRPGRVGLLRSFLSSFQRVDRRSINNGIYIGQTIMGLPKYYDDFEGFAKLGVSSVTLHLDYSSLRKTSEFLNLHDANEDGQQFEKAKEIGRVLTKYSTADLQLISCSLWYNGGLLTKKERERAEMLRNKLLQ